MGRTRVFMLRNHADYWRAQLLVGAWSSDSQPCMCHYSGVICLFSAFLGHFLRNHGWMPCMIVLLDILEALSRFPFKAKSICDMSTDYEIFDERPNFSVLEMKTRAIFLGSSRYFLWMFYVTSSSFYDVTCRDVTWTCLLYTWRAVMWRVLSPTNVVVTYEKMVYLVT